MLTVREKRPSLGNSDDQSKLNLPINDSLGEGNVAGQYETDQRVSADQLKSVLYNPADQCEVSGS